MPGSQVRMSYSSIVQDLMPCFNRSQGSFDDVCPWESMEKLPDKAPSLSQSVASTSIATASNKPCTSAAALAAAAVPIQPTPASIISSPPQPLKSVETESSFPPMVTSGPGLLSKQASITSNTSTVVSPTPTQKQAPSTVLAAIDNQKITVVSTSGATPPFSSSPPQQLQQPQPSTSNECGGGSTVLIPIMGSASNSTTTSKESVVQALSPAKTSNNFMKTSEQAMTCSTLPPQNPTLHDTLVPTCSSTNNNPVEPSTSISMQPPCQGTTSEDNNKERGEESKDICPWDHE